MEIKNIINIHKSQIRLFYLQTKDLSFIMYPDLPSSYLLSLLIDRIGFKLSQFSMTYVYPFHNFFDYIKPSLDDFQEEYFIFNLENYYHSSDYSYNFLVKILEYYKDKKRKPFFIIHTIKSTDKHIDEIINKYDNILLIINTDSEYFFQEFFYKKTPIDEISNIYYRDDAGIIHKTSPSSVDHELSEYIIGGYYNSYYQKFPKSKDEIISIRIGDKLKTYDDNIPHLWTNEKYRYVLKNIPENTIMLTSGRGCKYNCSYCYRGAKYKKVRQIPLEIIKKDLDYISNLGYEKVYFYDDCFVSTNYDRLDDILSLFGSYDLSYQIASRYETLTLENLEKLSNANIERIQIGLQSISIEANIYMKRNINMQNFKDRIAFMKEKGMNISLDLILGLPGETIKDFIKTFHFAVSLKPNSIFINTLFLNPKTELYDNKDKYGIVTFEDKKLFKSDFYVPQIYSSSTFSNNDLELARKYVLKFINAGIGTNIILR